MSEVESKLLTDVREIMAQLRESWALLYNTGSGNEGIYSRRSANGDNIVLVFELEEDAARYVSMLEAIDFPQATPTAVETQVMVDFCEDGGYQLGLVKKGVVVIPPDVIVEQFGWSPGASAEAAEPRSDESSEQRKALEALLLSTPGGEEE